MKYLSLFLITVLCISSCRNEKKEMVIFDFFLFEPCMIVNFEQDNTIEGRYLRASSVNKKEMLLKVKLPDNFYINGDNLENWLVGWGEKVRLYDAGSENLREIKMIDHDKNIIQLGVIKRGSGWPEKNQRIVFWNRNPSGYSNLNIEPIIDPSGWPELKGDFLNFAAVVYDSLLDNWVMLINDIDADDPKIFAAVSENLVHWTSYNDGSPILKASDFKNTSWAREAQYGRVPFATDLVYHNGVWHLFLDGHSIDGSRHMGLALSDKSAAGPFKVLDEPLLSPGSAGEWDERFCFYGKVTQFRDGFIMFYDGRNREGVENIGWAFSFDLHKWEKSSYNPVMPSHSGWRSKVGVSEPAYVEVRNDSIILLIAGAKNLKMPPRFRFQPNRMYLDVSGNVDDAQLGAFLSTDGGKTFIPHAHNPLFINDYANKFENHHLGANFERITTNSNEYIFYQAKSNYKENKYHIMLRGKLLINP